MKFLYLIIFFFSFGNSMLYSQGKVISLTPENLYNHLSNSDRDTVIQFWVPNCKHRVEILSNYKTLVQKYGNHIDFYFIGITNKESLVEDLMEEVGFNSNLYIIDKEISPNDLVNRKKKFNKDFIFLLKKRKTDFITGYINRKLSKINLNNSIKVNEQKLKRKIKKYNVENHL